MQDDSTFQYKLIDFLTNQWQSLAMIVILAIVVSGGFVSYQYFERSKEKSAQEQLFVLQNKLNDKTKQIDQAYQDAVAAQQKQVASETKSKKKAAKIQPPMPPVKTPETLAQNFGDILPQFTAFIRSHEGRKAAYMAAIRAASLAADYKDFKQAENILQLVINEPKHKDLFWGLLNGQYSGVLIQENKCEQAIPILEKIADNPAHAFFQAHALLRLGACYIQIKNYDKAEDAFVRIQTDFPQSEAAYEARDLKRLILIRQGQKS